MTEQASVQQPSATAPFPGVDQAEWEALLARGDAAGWVHAEAITHALRSVELTPEVLHTVHRELTARAIAIDESVDEVDDDVRAIGAANYMTIKDGRLTGHNNDGKGVVKAIAKIAPLKGQRVVMLGAGGAGRAMAVEIAWAGSAHLTLVTRREEQGREVAERVLAAWRHAVRSRDDVRS